MGELKAIQQKKEAILAVARVHGLHNVRIFGSVARGEDTPQSDIDLLVDLDKGCTLLDMGGGYRKIAGAPRSQSRYCDRTWAALVPTRTDHEGGPAVMKDDKLYLIHITESINKIESYMVGLDLSAFMKNPMVQDAVLRNLQVLAESTQRLSDGFKSQHPEVEWYKISGLRNILVHDYLGIDLETAKDADKDRRDDRPAADAVAPTHYAHHQTERHHPQGGDGEGRTIKFIPYPSEGTLPDHHSRQGLKLLLSGGSAPLTRPVQITNRSAQITIRDGLRSLSGVEGRN